MAGERRLTDLPQDTWIAARILGGHPEQEWTFPRFLDRVLMLQGLIPAYFYESVRRFETVKTAIAVRGSLREKDQPFGPSVLLGLEFFDSGYRVEDGRLPVPHPGDAYQGRHTVALVGYGKDALMFRNSWGERWGDRGFGHVSRDYFNAHVDEATITWSAVRGPSPIMMRCMGSKTMRRQQEWDRLTRCWMTTNEWEVRPYRLFGEDHLLITWFVVSLDTSRYVRVLEIRTPDRVAGRVHMFYPRRLPGSLMIRELFVAPELRRRGYGSLLDQWATEEAQEVGCPSIELWMHEADAQPGNREAAEAFAASRGYGWTPVDRRRPNVCGIASRATNPER